jgi:hypothetical protein
MSRIIAEAGVKDWVRVFLNLRPTRSTELAERGIPNRDFCRWLGHTPKVALEYYMQVCDAHFLVPLRRSVRGGCPRWASMPARLSGPSSALAHRGIPRVSHPRKNFPKSDPASARRRRNGTQGATKPKLRTCVFAVFADDCVPMHLAAWDAVILQYPRQGSNL